MNAHYFLYSVNILFLFGIAIIYYCIISLTVKATHPYLANVIPFEKAVVHRDFRPRIAFISALVNSTITAIRSTVPLTVIHFPRHSQKHCSIGRSSNLRNTRTSAYK